MPTEEGLDPSSPDQSVEEAAAFASAFDAEPGAATQEAAPAPSPAQPETPADDAPASKEEAAAPAAAPAAEAPAQEAAPTAPNPVPDAFATKDELRRLHGRIGELNDLVKKLQPKEAEGKPAAPAAVSLAKTLEQYPELAETLSEDLSQILATVGGKAQAPDPAALNAMVEQQVQQRLKEQRVNEITDVHPNWSADVWAQPPTADVDGVHTPDFAAWKATLQPGVAERLANSNSPVYVNARLSEFYEWKAKATQAAADKTSRLKDAITPQGVARAAPPAISDAEAERKAFSEAFNDG